MTAACHFAHPLILLAEVRRPAHWKRRQGQSQVAVILGTERCCVILVLVLGQSVDCLKYLAVLMCNAYLHSSEYHATMTLKFDTSCYERLTFVYQCSGKHNYNDNSQCRAEHGTIENTRGLFERAGASHA